MTATEQIFTFAAFAIIAAALLALLRDYLQHKQHTERLTRYVSERLDVPVIRYTSQGFKLAKAHPTDTCFDLYAAEDHVITKRRSIIKTGIRIKLPDGYCAEVRPRSGASAKLKQLTGTLFAPCTVRASRLNSCFMRWYSK